jgi:predicted TIM-barrel fold metal-dependent hydrolase
MGLKVKDMKIIDVHTHIGEYEKHWSHELAVGVTKGHSGTDYKKMWTVDLDEYMRDMDEANIDVSVVCGIDVTRIDRTKLPIDYIYDFIRRKPNRLIGFAGVQAIDSKGRFSAESLKNFEKAIKEYGFKGLKLHPSYSHYYPNDKACYPFYQKALELEVPVLIHMGTTPAPFAKLDMGRPIYLDDVAMDFPDLKICAAHLAYPWTQELYGLMRKCQNIYTDISAQCIRPTILAWNLVMAKEYNLMDRVMFGTDYPCCKPRKNFIEWCKTGVNRIAKNVGWPTLSQEDIENLLGKNAMEFLNLK